MNESNTCQGCDNEAQEMHTCPYAEEIGGDHDSLCNCCTACEDQCCEDI